MDKGFIKGDQVIHAITETSIRKGWAGKTGTVISYPSMKDGRRNVRVKMDNGLIFTLDHHNFNKIK